VELHARASRGEDVAPDELEAAVRASTREVVARQLEAGIDVGNDGEQSRESFFTHLRQRLSGFGGRSQRPVMADFRDYPSYAALKAPEYAGRESVNLMTAPKAVGPVKHVDRGPIERECRELARILGEQQRGFAQAFLTAPSPGIVATAMQNEFYESLEAYVDAVAEALRTEYEVIVGSGFLLQVDAPDLAMERHTLFADRPLEDFLAFAEHVVGALGRALVGVPRDAVRLHVCWGNYEGPHDRDVSLEAILPLLARAPVGAYLLSMANPRHAHEYRVLEDGLLPQDALVVCGAIDTTTNYVEHPEVVAQRIERVARALGDPHRVIAGTDCGFETAAGFRDVAPEVAWAKLRALREGADLASRRLLG
jgi:5-methyltetrahydropteroyltriglutamate--homocysteine methyltransferase